MFAKKKSVPAISRSRFTKAKPKITPKGTSQQNIKVEKVSLDEIKAENNLSTQLPAVNENIEETQSNKRVETPQISEQSRSIDDEISEQSNERISQSKEVLATNSFSDKESNAITINGPNLTGGFSFADASSIKNSLHLDNASSHEEDFVDKILDNSINEFEENLNSVSPSKSSSNVVIYEDLESTPNLVNDENAIESPEKSVGYSPTKAAGVDKSAKYPCISRLLAGPKKRSQNKEINDRKKKMAAYKELPPRSEMTFTDLIYWKPNTSPMKPKEQKSAFFFDPKDKEPEEEIEEEEEDEESTSIAPKLLLNENGDIIIDESSLVVKRKKSTVFNIFNLDDDDNVTYSTYRKRVTKPWSATETVKFYKALSVVGTDFALMENIMPNRARRELKIKFKKEEKINCELLHRAMYDTDTFQTDLNMEDLDLDAIDIPGLEEIVDNPKEQTKKKTKRSKKEQIISEITSNGVTDETDSSPLPKKRRGRPKRVLSSDESSDELCEIEVQIDSPPNQENSDSLEEEVSVVVPEQVNETTVQQDIVVENVQFSDSDANHKEITNQLPKPYRSNSANNTKKPYKRTRLPKSVPKIKIEKQKLVEQSTVETQDIMSEPISPGSLSVIEITDDQLLSDCVTDVVTEPRWLKRKVASKNATASQNCLNGNPGTKLQTLSYINYTLMLEESEQDRLMEDSNDSDS